MAQASRTRASSDSRTILADLVAVEALGSRGYGFADEHGTEHFVCFADLVSQVRRRAAALQALGVARSEHLALVVRDQEAFITTFLAALAAGVVPVPIAPPQHAVLSERWAETAVQILSRSGAGAIVLDDEASPPIGSALAALGIRPLPLSELAAVTDAAFTPVQVTPDDLAFLQFTSGSTATPRGVMVSHRNIIANCTGIVHHLLRGVETVGVSWLPLHHDMGLIGFVLAPLLGRCSVFFLETSGFVRRPALWFELINRHRASVTFAPSFGYALATRRVKDAELARWDLSCVAVAGCGAEPIAADTLRRFAERFAGANLRHEALRPCYGLAEATLLATCGPAGQPFVADQIDSAQLIAAGADGASHRRDSEPVDTRLEVVGCGRALPEHELRVVAADGECLPDRTIGEVELRGPSVTRGYYRDPASTSTTYRDHWLRTGDLGYLVKGELFITGRKKELIIVNGHNYAPQTIEWAAHKVDGIRMGGAVAFSIPDARGTECVVLVCEATTRREPQLERAVRERVRNEVGLGLERVVFVRPGTLPRTSSGKPQRLKARALYLGGRIPARDGGPHQTSVTSRPTEIP